MKVAVIATSPTRGGAEEYLYWLYEQLKADYGVQPTLIGSLPDWPDELGPTIAAGSSAKLSMSKPLLRQGMETVLSAVEVLRIMRQNDFDLAHIQFFQPKLTLARLLSRRMPVLWTEHGPLPTNLPTYGRKLVQFQSRSCCVVSVSDAVAESLHEAGIDSTVVWNPLPALSRPSEFPVKYARKTVLFAGRVHQAKRIDLLIDAAALLPDVDVIIAGDGPQRSALESRATKNVMFLGTLPNVDALLQSVDAVVVTSGRQAREGSPMIVLEARVAAVPVLMANDCHAAGEAVSLGGQIYEPTAPALAEAIDALVKGVRVPLNAEMLHKRSVSAWAKAHFEIMSQVEI